MDLFWKALAGVLLTAVLTLALSKQEKDISLLLKMGVCAMVAIIAVSYFDPVLTFLRQLEELGDLQGDMLGILLKAVGIGMVAEIAGMICADSGNASLGKILQLLSSGVILWLSLPIFSALLEMIQQILGGL